MAERGKPSGQTDDLHADINGQLKSENAMDVEIDTSKSAEDILRAIRRINQSITIHSKKLYRKAGITVPQLLCLRAIGQMDLDEITATELSREVQLSKATVTGILDRLERCGFIFRERRSKDRRKICLNLTELGRARLENLDPSLQDRFLMRLMTLEERERRSILKTLKLVVEMIEASSIEASPILITGDIKDSTHGS